MVEQLGSETLLIFGIEAPPVTADAVRAASEADSDDDGSCRRREPAMFTASVDGKRPLPSGELLLAVDFTAMHCFSTARAATRRRGAAKRSPWPMEHLDAGGVDR